MQSVRDALEEIMRLADDQTWSHAARMLKIKGIASQALTELNEAPLKRGPGRPKKDDGGKAGDKVQESDSAGAGEAG